MTQEKLTKSELKDRQETRRKAIEAERAKQAQALQSQLVKSNTRRQAEWATVGPKLTEKKNERRLRRMEISQQVVELGRKNRLKAVGKDTEESVDDLRKKAEGLGVDVDKRWGADRLKSEIAAKEKA